MSNVSFFPFKSRLYCIVELVEWWEREWKRVHRYEDGVFCASSVGCTAVEHAQRRHRSNERKRQKCWYTCIHTHARILVDTLNVHRFKPFRRSIKNVHSNSPVSIKICGFLLMILLPTIYSHNMSSMIEKQFGFYFYLKYDFALFLWFSNYLYETQYPFWLFKLVLAYFFCQNT